MLERVYDKIKAHYNIDGLVMGDGPKNARIMLIGEAPGKDEVINGRPFCGKAGKNLDSFLQVLEINRSDIYISNVVKFRPHRISAKGTVANRPPTRKEILEALPFLYEEIGALSPALIVTLGNTPLRAACGDFSATIGDYHGKLSKVCISSADYNLFALYHPASIIYNRSLADVYEEDLHILKKQLGDLGL